VHGGNPPAPVGDTPAETRGTPANIGDTSSTRTAAADGPGARPGTDIAPGPLGGQPESTLRDTRRDFPGTGAHPGTGFHQRAGRGGVGEVLGRATRGGQFGVVPSGAAKSDEDKEHRGRYAVPESEIFEPDNDDGLLHDPFHPGSYVAPASIGDDDE
jgi:hypothetical protein